MPLGGILLDRESPKRVGGHRPRVIRHPGWWPPLDLSTATFF
ncbi:hypothetical protein TPY_0896 [Sulfobacillus acidophilus TPY]|nr:hypothetical protein TPY_0896 [Sulfobacillus acidophilus TPY]